MMRVSTCSEGQPLDDAPAQDDAVAPVGRAHGACRLRFAAGDYGTCLAGRDQYAPARILTPRDPGPGLAGATLVNEAGGLAGGDRLHQGVTADAGAGAIVTTQAAEKVYRATGPATAVATQLTVGEGAWLEWLPQETILFDGAHLRRSITADVAPTGQLLAGELLVLGRRARGEWPATARLLDSWRARRGGALCWADGLRLAPPNPALSDAAGFAGYAASATLVYVAPAAQAWQAYAQKLLDARTGATVQGGVTCVGGVLLIRLLAGDGAELRDAVSGIWAAFRSAVAGLPARLPAVWHI